MDATIDDRLPPRSLVIIGAKIVQCKQPFFLRVESETTTHNGLEALGFRFPVPRSTRDPVTPRSPTG